MPRGARPRPRGARGPAALALVAVLGVAVAWGADRSRDAAASPVAPTESDVKAAFLYNFGRFVEWPEGSLPADGTFVIGAVGADPFGHALDELEGKEIGGRRIVVRRWTRLTDPLPPCQILFISASEADRLTELLGAVDDRPVLTVADTEGWAERGVMVNFRTRERRVRFEINLRRAEAAGLKMSSQLLKLATLVAGGIPAP